MKTNPNWDALILAVREGNSLAQNSMTQWYWKKIYQYIHHQWPNKEEAEDITIETLTKVLTKIDLFDTKQNLDAWVLTIAKRTMIDHLRKKSISTEPLETQHIQSYLDETPEEQMILEQQQQSLSEKIKTLSPIYKSVWTLRMVDRLSIKSIAQTLDITENTVKVRLNRAKEQLFTKP